MPAADAATFSDSECDDLFAVIADRAVIALAVSGGADSLALMLLARRWQAAGSPRPRIIVLTVDHQLRPSSADEARMVAARADECGFAHRILAWTDPKPANGIEEAAREARYRLLRSAAIEEGATDVLTAHHRDDQAETVLMRLGGGSGLAGLRGMRPVRALDGEIVLRRPLLAVPKARLRSLVDEAGWQAAEDETNADEAFLRPRLRALLPSLHAVGLTPGRIARSAERLARADDALEHYTDLLLTSAVTTNALAVATLDRSAYRTAPVEVRHRALARLLAAIGDGGWPPPRGDRLETLDAALVSEGRFKRTLGGTEISADGDHVAIYRECGRLPLPAFAVAKGASGVWDRRFAFRVEKGPRHGLVIGPLGSDRIEGEAFEKVPRSVVAALPVLRVGGAIVAAAGTTQDEGGDVAASFRSVIDEGIWRGR